METYSMSQIEVLTGISAHKLRIWERRYDFLKPQRTATNIRYYTANQLTKLLNVSILNRNGFKISKIAKMSIEEMNATVSELLTNNDTDYTDEINAFILSTVEYNENEFQQTFQRCILRKGFVATITEIIYPFLNQVGVLWGTNKIIASQEHFISNLIRQKIISAIDALPLPLENAPSIIMFLLDNEDHEIGLLLSSFIAKNLGWKVYYLGQRVPNYNISSIVESLKPDLLLTFFITPQSTNSINETTELFKKLQTPLLVSGSNIPEFILKNTSSKVISNPDELINALEKQSVEI